MGQKVIGGYRFALLVTLGRDAQPMNKIKTLHSKYYYKMDYFVLGMT
jgi:hypothetical protein